MKYLNDAGDKLFSNKEFIMTQVRGEPSPDLILDSEPDGSQEEFIPFSKV